MKPARARTGLDRFFAPGFICLALGTASAIAGAQVSDEAAFDEPAWKETPHVLPDAPGEENLRAFELSPPSANRYLIDTATLTVSADGVIRYVLVVKSSRGAANATFEGLRCATAERRIYASLERGGNWRPFKNGKWSPIGQGSHNPRAALAIDYFCDGPVPARSREEILARFAGHIDYIDPMRGIQP
jgi:hypothetical protein